MVLIPADQVLQNEKRHKISQDAGARYQQRRNAKDVYQFPPALPQSSDWGTVAVDFEGDTFEEAFAVLRRKNSKI